MVAPTIYRWDDASAPSLSGEVDSLISVLDDILVNGYGALSAAGWTKEYSGTNKAAYKQAGGNERLFRIVDDGTTSAKYCRIVGYESMTDVDTGVGPFPTDAQFTGGLYIHKSTAAGATVRPWIAFATEQSVLFYCLPSQIADQTAATYVGGFYFGDFDSNVVGDDYNTAIWALPSTIYSSSGAYETCSTDSGTTDAGCYVCRDHSAVGSAGFDKRTASGVYQTQFGRDGVAYPDPISGGLNLSPVLISEATYILRGTVPGIWQINHNYTNFNMLDTFSGESGGNLDGKEFIFYHAGNSSCLAIETNGGWL